MSYNATIVFSALPGRARQEQYKLFISKDNISWEDTFPDIGTSPITITPTFDGKYNSYVLTGLENYTKYYFKIAGIDQFNNQAGSSVAKDVTIYTPDYGIQNFYRTAGGLLTGIYPIPANSGNGTIEAGMRTYGAYDYGEAYYEVSALYYSYILFSATGFSSIVFTGVGNAGDISIYYREYIQGVPGAWSAGQSGIGVGVTLALAGQKFIQLKYVFKNATWTTSDNITVTQINEL